MTSSKHGLPFAGRRLLLLRVGVPCVRAFRRFLKAPAAAGGRQPCGDFAAHGRYRTPLLRSLERAVVEDMRAEAATRGSPEPPATELAGSLREVCPSPATSVAGWAQASGGVRRLVNRPTAMRAIT